MPTWVVKELIESSANKYREVLAERGKDPKILEEFLRIRAEHKQLMLKLNTKRQELNKLSEQYKVLRTNQIQEQAKELKAELKELEQHFSELSSLYDKGIRSLPNVLEVDVPDGLNEEDNLPIKYSGINKVWTNNIEVFLSQAITQLS